MYDSATAQTGLLNLVRNHPNAKVKKDAGEKLLRIIECLPEEDIEIAAMMFGLADGRPMDPHEIAAETGVPFEIADTTVRRILEAMERAHDANKKGFLWPRRS